MKFAVGSTVTFLNEPAAVYIVHAIGRRYAVCVRTMTVDDLEQFGEQGEVGDPIYTILDRETWTRGPHNLILNPYDFHAAEGCEECLRDLQNGEIELSRRYSVPATVESLCGVALDTTPQRNERDDDEKIFDCNSDFGSWICRWLLCRSRQGI